MSFQAVTSSFVDWRTSFDFNQMVSDKKDRTHQREHVLITDYLTDANKNAFETKAEEYNTIAVSPNDHRWYRLIELRNGLRCMLITSNLREEEEDEHENDEDDDDGGGQSSEQVDTTESRLKSTAETDDAFSQYQMTTVALSIPVGSLLDPFHLQGLAHLSEHLLFSSSRKYPEMNCLDTFISYHGGTIHAYTELEYTMIVIEIPFNRLLEALDILIHSIIDPLISPESISNQVQILDDESRIAQMDDHYRASRLLAHLAEENHPLEQFFWGNKISLRDLLYNVETQTFLQQWIKDRYCIPERMNLVLISNESFRAMQQRVERLFCLMKRSFQTLPDYNGLKSPWHTNDFQKFHLVHPVEDIHQLRLSFPLVPADVYWRIKPADYVRYIFGHEAPGSLSSYLKNKLWIRTMEFDLGDSQLYRNSSSSLFTIILHLTRQGLKNLQSIIDSVFEAVYLLKRLGPLKRVYDDMQLADLHAFLFQEKTNAITYADTIAQNLRKYPALFVLFGHHIHLQFEPVSIFKTIEALDPRTCNFMLMSKLVSPYCDRLEPWFQIKYGQYEIPNKWISYWLNPNVNPALSIPDSSQYLAVDFSIKPFDLPPSDIPISLIKESFGTLWYFRNQQTLPKAFFYLHFLSPYVNLTPQHSCLFDLYTLILNSLLRAHAYPGKASHISMQFSSTDTGLILKLTGFNQHLSKYLETLLKVIQNFQIQDESLAAWKQELKDEYHRTLLNDKTLIKHVRLYLMKNVWWPAFEKIQFLDTITSQQINDFSTLFRSHLTMNMLVAGNITGEESREIFHTSQNLLRLGPVYNILLPTLRAVQIPVQENLVKVESYSIADCATHMLLFYEHGVASIRDYVLVEIIAEIIQESLDDYFQSMGPNHFTCQVTLRDTYGIISIQIELIFSSELYHSLDILNHVNKFFSLFKDLVMDTNKSDFERYITMFRNVKQSIDNSLPAQVERLWTEIFLHSLVFDRPSRERDALNTLTVSDMQEWYNEHILFPHHRQLIIIVCTKDEISRTTTELLGNHSTIPETRSHRPSVRSSLGTSMERLPRVIRRQDLAEEEEGRLSLFQSKSESKLRCITTKRKHHVDLRPSQSESFQLLNPVIHADENEKLPLILKSFESIEINDELTIHPERIPLKILSDKDHDSSKDTYIPIDQLKQFKESCLLYNVSLIK